MKFLTFLAVFALIGAVCGQTTEDNQKKGGTIEQLTAALERNSDVTTHNAQKIDELPGVLEMYYKRQTGTIIGGVAVFIVICYLSLAFFDRVRKRKRKVTYEEHIRLLEETLKAREDAVLTVLKENNRFSGELLERCDMLLKRQPLAEPVDKREIALNVGTLLMGLGLMGLTGDAAKEFILWDMAILWVLYRIMYGLIIFAGVRMWLLHYKTRVVE